MCVTRVGLRQMREKAREGLLRTSTMASKSAAASAGSDHAPEADPGLRSQLKTQLGIMMAAVYTFLVAPSHRGRTIQCGSGCSCCVALWYSAAAASRPVHGSQDHESPRGHVDDDCSGGGDDQAGAEAGASAEGGADCTRQRAWWFSPAVHVLRPSERTWRRHYGRV